MRKSNKSDSIWKKEINILNQIEYTNENIKFLKDIFRKYYFENKYFPYLYSIEKREFGYRKFDSLVVRHLSFKNIGELEAELVRNVPLDVYYSNAYYGFPSNPISEKQWEGADLIFDIDIKDLNIPCFHEHTYYICNLCGFVNSQQKLCNNCNKGKTYDISIPCKRCFTAIKKEAAKLLEFLRYDLGIEEKFIEIFFSGNAGFHFHVNDPSMRNLDSNSRSNVTDYIIGNGFMCESIGVRKYRNGFMIKLPKSGIMNGWRKKIASSLGINQKSELKLKHLVEASGGYDGFRNEINRITKKFGVHIDSQVTNDIHRVFRLPGSINGKSGLTKTKCDDLESFNPNNDACMLGDSEVYINLKTKLKINLKNNNFKLDNVLEKVPSYVAVYLVCKGLATISKNQ
jgi:DNA primase small subunit